MGECVSVCVWTCAWATGLTGASGRDRARTPPPGVDTIMSGSSKDTGPAGCLRTVGSSQAD